ncbi:unnamed protein product [Caretta caretta]
MARAAGGAPARGGAAISARGRRLGGERASAGLSGAQGGSAAGGSRCQSQCAAEALRVRLPVTPAGQVHNV